MKRFARSTLWFCAVSGAFALLMKAYALTINTVVFFITSRLFLLFVFPTNCLLGLTSHFFHWPSRDYIGYAALFESIFFTVLFQGLIGFAVSYRPTFSKALKTLAAAEGALILTSFALINIFPDMFYVPELILPSRNSVGRANNFSDWVRHLPSGSEEKFRTRYDRLDSSQRSLVMFNCLESCDRPKKLLVVTEYFKTANEYSEKMGGLMTLGKKLDPDLVPILESFLKDENPAVRSEAACQLAKTTGKLYEYDGDYRPWIGDDCQALQARLQASFPPEKKLSDGMKMKAVVLAAYEASTRGHAEKPIVPLNENQIKAVLFPDRGMAKYRWMEWLRIVSDLPEPARSKELDVILKSLHPSTLVVDDIWSSGDYSEAEVEKMHDFLRVLGKSGRSDVFALLEMQGMGLENGIRQERYGILQDISLAQDERAGKDTAAVERDTGLLRDIKIALASLSRASGHEAIMWTTSEWVFSMGNPANDHYILSFRIMSLNPTVTLTVLDRRTMAPFQDSDGVLWDSVRLNLSGGSTFPYEGTFSIRGRLPSFTQPLKLILHSRNGPDCIIDCAGMTKDEAKFN